MSCGLHGRNGFTVRLPLLFDLMADCQPYTLLEDPDPEDVAANRDRKVRSLRLLRHLPRFSRSSIRSCALTAN